VIRLNSVDFFWWIVCVVERQIDPSMIIGLDFDVCRISEWLAIFDRASRQPDPVIAGRDPGLDVKITDLPLA
jgi:hypothetical protein